ncbi:MAG: class I SAM-dependent methyltransferase [Nitrospirota bacterium]|nr:class I SAM-dependent methyltransferase [Nitrospirota bacterium]
MNDNNTGSQENALAELSKHTGAFVKKLLQIEQSINQKADESEMTAQIVEAAGIMEKQCDEFERAVAYDKDIIKSAQARFRADTDIIFLKSYFLLRARTWPAGNAGDHETIESIYRNAPLSSGIGRILDQLFLKSTLAMAVKERKEVIKQLLKREIKKRNEPKMLNVASGSCRELVEIAQDIKTSNTHLICVDISSQALEAASMRLSYANLGTDQVQFRKYNALKMISSDRNIKEFGKQDIIYSIGLFDYLSDDMLVRLLSALYDCLEPGGVLITSYKDKEHYKLFDYHWLTDWTSFYQRSKEHVRQIYASTNIPATNVAYEKMNLPAIYFILATKP